MRSLLKGLWVVALLMTSANCQKEEFTPPDSQTHHAQVLPRSSSDELFFDLLNDFRAEIQTLTDAGIFKGKNGTGILNRLDYVERKFLLGQKEEAVNMLNELISHLRALCAGGVITPQLCEELVQEVKNMILLITTDCMYAPTVIAINGLNVNLPPSGSASLPPDIFVVYTYDKCGGTVTLSFSPDPDDQSLDLNCQHVGVNIVEAWATNLWGRQDYAQTYVYVQDNTDACPGGGGECAPVAVSHNLAVELDMYGLTTLSAADLDGGSMDVCGTGSLSFSVRKAGDSSAPAETITFGYEDVGVVLVELWVSDGTHASMVLTQVWVQDNIAPV